jgi:NitT/TauT family transport system ATP-binding protein
MLPTAALAQDQLGIPLQTPLVLSYDSAFISLSQKLCYALDIKKTDDAATTAQKFFSAMQHEQYLPIAHVFKQSIHHYCLREWLALANPEFAKRVHLRTLPPPYMVEAISNQLIDGFCVGEPWNTQAEIQGYSQIIATGSDIIPRVADKVLAVTQEWAIALNFRLCVPRFPNTKTIDQLI